MLPLRPHLRPRSPRGSVDRIATTGLDRAAVILLALHLDREVIRTYVRFMATPEDLYRSWLFELWYGDYAVAERLFTPEAVGHWPTLQVNGPNGFADQIRQSHEMFAEIENTLDVGPIIDDGLVAARWTFHGSYRGGIPGATADIGTRVAFSGHDIFRIEGDRFAEYWVLSNVQAFMTALGLS